MENRDMVLKQLRPAIEKAKVLDQTGSTEKFQNQTLRPVVKLQHNLLLAFFSQYIRKRKNVFHTLDLNKRLAYIENALYKDTTFKNSIKGIIIGQFTLTEYETYLENPSALNKRITTLIKERLQDNIQLFEKKAS